MPSPVITAALQAGSLSATSNVLAQALAAFRHEKPFQLNPIPVFQFALFNFLNTPPNYAWQQFLENTYPGYTDQGKPHDDKDIEKASAKTLNVKNTFTKFFLDQTLGATVNTILFSLAIGIMKGLSVSEILGVIQRDFWPIIIGGLKLWPVVSILNFTVVPVEKRIVVGSLAGLFWGIYLSIIAS